MLTRMFFAAPVVSRPSTSGIAALTLLAAFIGAPPAQAGEGMAVGSCVGSYGSLSCAAYWGPRVDTHIRRYTPPKDEQLEKEAAARERQWVARCRPVLREDRYGVSRYEYAAPGCEFGKTRD